MNNCKKLKGHRNRGPLKLQEIECGFMTLIKLAQRESFSEEYERLTKHKSVKSTSKILSLNPFIDSEGIMRVGGRLKNAEFSFDKKHPIILSPKHYLTKLIFEFEHAQLLHAGPQTLLASIREKFWSTSGRCLARKIVRQCVICFRSNPEVTKPIMGDLPPERLQIKPPFDISGVDYAGPFFVKDRRGRGAKVSKVYVSLFICFVTKAIHLELVTDLTKDAFILALRRFASRRGKPSHIFSDNGKNFVSARSELTELANFISKNETNLIDAFTQENIEWQFIPPYSPHFGGLWEAGIKIMKSHLKRVLGTIPLTFEELYTLLTQVEAILNSRPLSPLSSDPSDLTPLTPAHFLIGRPLTEVPDPNLREIPQARLSRYQHVQKMKQHIWDRWNKEYISELQQRLKWKKTQSHLKEGAMVLIKEDKLPSMQWRLGRIVAVYPGKDNITRVADIQTAAGVIKRSFSKICVLPFSASDSDN